MKETESTKKTGYGMLWMIALVCFLLLLTVSYAMVSVSDFAPFGEINPGQEKQAYDMIVLGDSVMGQYRDETSIPAQIARLSGKSVFNGAFGGTCLSRYDLEKRVGFTKDCMSVSAIARAVATEDFRVQQTVRIRESATEYFAETIDAMEKIDFAKAETIIICAGTNDYHVGAQMDSEEDAFDEYTFAGALRSTIQTIQQAYPDMRIILITPTYTWYTVHNLTCEEYETGDYFLEEYVEAELAVAEEMGVEVIDLYHDFYTHENWEDWQKYTIDGVHPNEATRGMIAEKIAAYLQETN